MVYVNRNIRTPEEGAAFVRACELDFSERLNSLVRDIVHRKHATCVALAGPTCAGKTTMAAKLTAGIENAGKRAVILSIDDFFYERTSPKLVDTQVDFDTVAAIDLEFLGFCVCEMLAGRKVLLPKFDFRTGRRMVGEEYIPTPDDILIFEGIQAVYPEVTALFEGYPCESIFVCVNDAITVNGVCFEANEVRLCRRIVRDFRFRSASPEFTMNIWKNVRENEEKNIFPYRGGCHYIIDSLQLYELFMIGQFLIPLLRMVPSDDACNEEASVLLQKLLCLQGNEISPDCLPADALYREFLG